MQGLLELEQQEYDDAGGTGGKLEADRIVFDERAKNAKQTMSAEELAAQADKVQGLSDQQLQTMWMRRVQTTPGDFLRLKFSYQQQKQQE